MQDDLPTGSELKRIADALDRLAPPPLDKPRLGEAEAYVWQPSPEAFIPVERVNRVPLLLLKGLDRTIEALLGNTERFAIGLPANNALLWGARGMGKSSAVKAVHAEVRRRLEKKAAGSRQRAAGGTDPLPAARAPLPILIEIHREDISSLPRCLNVLKGEQDRFIVFCDDLSFDGNDTSYKSLKAALEGGIEGRPENVIFYATSNRRHLLPRDMMENERGTAINPGEAVEEKVSLSDRFGLWLGFHNCSQTDYLEMVRSYAAHFGLKVAAAELERASLEWSVTRGSRSGRVAWQFIQDLAGRMGKRLELE